MESFSEKYYLGLNLLVFNLQVSCQNGYLCAYHSVKTFKVNGIVQNIRLNISRAEHDPTTK